MITGKIDLTGEDSGWLLLFPLLLLIFSYFNIRQQFNYFSDSLSFHYILAYILIAAIYLSSLIFGFKIYKEKFASTEDTLSDVLIKFVINYSLGYALISLFAQITLASNPNLPLISVLAYFTCFPKIAKLAVKFSVAAIMLLVVYIAIMIYLFFSGTTKTDVHNFFDEVEISTQVDDKDKFVELSKKQCDEGIMTGCTNLGVAYRLGMKVKKNLPLSYKLLKKACDGGNIFGCYNLGGAYAGGYGVKVDAKKAFIYMKKSCDANYADGCYGVAEIYSNGFGVKKDLKKADEYYFKACKKGHFSSCGKLKKK